MQHFFSSSSIFFFLVGFILLCSCTGQEKVICNEDVKTESIVLKYPQKTVVEYKMARNFIDVSQSLMIERWGPDEIKRYIMQLDTLTISWSESPDIPQDSAVVDLIQHNMDMHWRFSCNHSIIPLNLNELNGAIGEGICKDHATMLFFGVNASTRQSVFARYEVQLPNSNFRNEFVCILSSMHFKQ